MILFGSPARQQLLLSIAAGHQNLPAVTARRLVRTGLLLEDSALSPPYAFDHRHPAFSFIWQTLQGLSPSPLPMRNFAVPQNELVIEADHPLGHSNRLTFRVLFQLARANDRLTVSDIRSSMPDASQSDIGDAVRELHAIQNVVVEDDFISLSKQLPNSFISCVLTIGAHLARFDERFRYEPAPEFGLRPVGFVSTEAVYSRLFGTDARVRHLVALAREGPLHLTELRRITGVGQVKLEDAKSAIFGRGFLVRTWNTDKGPAAMLDPDFPAAHELRLFLRALEPGLKLPPLHRRLATPSPPPRRLWNGDHYGIFGGKITTSILLTIGAIGWAFEAICVQTCVGCHRENVKKALHRLERESIVVSERSQRPGFDPRIVRLSNDLPAMLELRKLIDRCLIAWPEFALRANAVIEGVHPKTRGHLESRGLLPLEKSNAKQLECDDREKLRSLCLEEYAALSTEDGKKLASTELGRRHSNLYRRILRHWGSMKAFRVDADAPATRSGTREEPDGNLKARCLREYAEMSRKLGYDPNTSALIRENESGLRERIVKAWGSFPAFCADQRPQLSRQRKDPNRSIETKRADCIAEYRAIAAELGYNPTVQELKSGIRKSVLKCWPTFTAFYDEAGIVTRRPVRRFRTDEDRRSYCILSYSKKMEQLGHAPSSVELSRMDVALHGLIIRTFGNFSTFCRETNYREPRVTRAPIRRALNRPTGGAPSGSLTLVSPSH